MHMRVGRDFAIVREEIRGRETFVQYTSNAHTKVANVIYLAENTTVNVVFIKPVDHAAAVDFVIHLK